MNHFANRAFSTLSLALYLGLFAFVAKLSFNSSSIVSISLPSLSLFSPRPPQMDWMNAMIPVKIEKENLADSQNFKIKELKAIKHAKVELTPAKTIVMKPELIVAKPLETNETFAWKSVVVKKELPVETIQNYLSQVEFNAPSYQYLALYNDFKMDTPKAAVAVVDNTRAPAETAAPIVEDKVSTSLASNVTVEEDLVLYDYQDETPAAVPATEAVVVENSAPAKIQKEVIHTTIVERPENKNVDKVEEVAIGDLLTFDYSQAQTVSPKVSAVPVPAKKTQAPEVKKATSTETKNEYSSGLTTDEKIEEQEGFVGKNSKSLPNRTSVAISAVSVNGDGDLLDMKSFEVQFKDDAADYAQDLSNGTVVFDYSLNDVAATRTAKLIAKNHVTTHMDLTLEQRDTSEMMVAMTEEYFSKLQNKAAVTGGLLVKVDSAVADIEIDKSFSKKIYFDENFLETKNPDYSFIYFANVPSGNVTVNFVTKHKGIRKILFVQDGELTYEKNTLEDLGQVKLVMYEDNLLSKEKTPLNINAEEMTEFIQHPRTEKLSLNTYKLGVGNQSYGARLYLELAHQKEPIFVGVGENKKISIPSEDYLRLILSNFPEGKLKSRCMIQVNLAKKAVELFHQAEGVEDALITSAQMVDKDGRFHHSISSKTEKIFVQGEYQGNSKADPNGIIHLKVKYADGTSDFLKTFCSPNTYLVEQL
jgi:hypothetical protein